AHELGLGKAGAGLLAAAYLLGALCGSIPSGIVAARLGVKPTVLVGLSVVALTTALFGIAQEAWQLDLARFVQGLASAFSWTGALAWLVAAAPPGKRGALIGKAFAAAVAGALFGPVLGGVASVAGTAATFSVVAVASLGIADRRGPVVPVRVGLIGTVVATAILPWPSSPYVLGVVIVGAAVAFGTFYTPGMTILTHAAEHRGLDYGYAFALINMAWAPGQ